MILVIVVGVGAVADIDGSADDSVGDDRLSPTFQANSCNRGACAGSILSPSLRTNAAPELACREWVTPSELLARRGEACAVALAVALIVFGTALDQSSVGRSLRRLAWYRLWDLARFLRALYWHSAPVCSQVLQGFPPEHLRFRD